MIGILISYLTQKFQTFNYLQTVYGLAGFEDGDNKYLWVYQNNEKVLLNLDTHQSCSLFLTNGKVDTTQEESQLVANEYNVTKKYPFKALIYIQGNENVNCSTESQRIADSIQRSITGIQKQILASTQLTDAYIEVTATDFDKDAIYQRYYSSGGLQEKDILIEIEFDFVISGNQDCFVDSPCDDGDYIFSFDAPKTLCEKINECLDIPTSNGQYVLDITGGVKSWSEYSLVISKTQAQFLQLVTDAELEFPAVYKITDIQNGLFVNTLSANTFSNEASLSFLAPDYTLHAQYHHTDGALANNAIVTWGGFYWQNTSGGSATPDLHNEGTISTNGFTKITKSVANGYVPIILAVTIQVAQGTIYIVSAKDDRDNYIEQSIAAQISLPFIPLEVNQWNNLTIFGNKVLVCNNVVYFNNPMDLSSINDNSGTFSFTSEIPFLISRISQNKLTGQGSTIKGNVTHTCSIIYRNTLSGLSSSIDSNYQNEKCLISGNTLSGLSSSIDSNYQNEKCLISGNTLSGISCTIEGYYQTSLSTISSNVLSGNPSANGSVTIAYGTLDGYSHLNGNTLSGDGAQFFDNHQHEACEINGNTLSGDNTRISHVIQIKTDKCNNNTISADNELIDMVFQDGTLCELNNNTITAGKSIENLRMSNSQIVNSTVKIKEFTVQGIAIDLTGFTTDIDGETYQNGGWFTITHNFATSPLNSGSSVYYNLIPNGARLSNITAIGTLTGTTIEIGLETDDEGIISGNVGLLPLSWSGFSNAATGNRSLKIKAVGGNITAGSLTVKIEFVL